MSAETVTSKIEEKARAAAEVIIAEAKEKAEAEKTAVTKDAAERVKKLLDQAVQNADVAEKGRQRADALNTKLGILELKRELLSSAKAEAKIKLSAMDEKAFLEIFSKYLSDSELSGEFVLLPSAGHRSLCEKTVAKLADKAGIKLTVSDKDSDLDSGFMLSSESYDLEFSIDAVLDEVFEKHEKEIADILFETGDVK